MPKASGNSKSVSYKQFNGDDIAQLNSYNAQIKSWSDDNDRRGEARAALGDLAMGEGYQGIVALDRQGNLLGVASYADEGNVYVLYNMASKESGHGVGTSMLRKVASKSVKGGGLYFESLPTSAAYYDKLGIPRTGKSGFLGPDTIAYEMSSKQAKTFAARGRL